MTSRQRLLALVAVAAVILAAWVATLLIGSYLDHRARTDQIVIDQSRENQLHVDCVVAVLVRQDPPKCRGVREQLLRDGIIPTPTTTTTTPSG